MQDMLDALAGLTAGFGVADVPFYEAESFPLFRRDQLPHHIKVVLVPGEEVVEAHDALTVREQRLQQVGTYEARHAGDEPCARFFFDPLKEFAIVGHQWLQRKGFGAWPLGAESVAVPSSTVKYGLPSAFCLSGDSVIGSLRTRALLRGFISFLPIL